ILDRHPVERAQLPQHGADREHVGALVDRLAADLKAFKSGARIAARSYSLPALLAHWTRRHRTLALALALAAVVAAAGIALYVRSVATERDRADRSESKATASLNELTLKHAELLLTTDPSAVSEVMAAYRGDNATRAEQIRAEARGRGVAALQAVPHTETVYWLQGLRGGDVVSLSTDGTVARTSVDGRSQVIARGVKKRGPFAYAASHHLLAYTCDPDDICLLEITSGKLVRAGVRDRMRALAFSPDGRQLAAVSASAEIRVYDVELPQPPVERHLLRDMKGGGLLFLERDALVLGTPTGMTLVHPSQPGGNPKVFNDPDAELWAPGPGEHQMAMSTTTGQVYFIDTGDVRVTVRTQPCHDVVSGLRTLPGKGLVAYACREGTIGVIDPRTGAITPKAHLDGHASRIEVSSSGEYLVAMGDKGTPTLIDLQTQIATPYLGQATQLTAVAPPDDEYPFVLSADARGGIRAWPVPERLVRVVAAAQDPMLSMIYSPLDRTVIGASRQELLVYAAERGIGHVDPHTEELPFIEPAANGTQFAMYGSNSMIEFWTLPPLAQSRVLDTRHGTVSRLQFVDGTEDILTSGKDGRLVRWSSSGDPHLIHHFERPIETFHRLGDGTIVVATEDGALWRVSAEQQVTAIRAAGARVTRIAALPDRTSLCIGFSDGTAAIWDARAQSQLPLTHASDAIRDIAVAPDGKMIALASADSEIRVGIRGEGSWTTTTWTTLAANARRIAWTHDGVLVSIGGDGAVWLYSSTRRTWLYLRIGTTALTQIAFDEAETTAFVFDGDGRLMTIDLNESRKRLSTRDQLLEKR
ncbi:MAG TPA: WD40 repeat domain-containing protein, partial [Kofleriaceae bacterium]|nr:WD40 repeat domain-containing protein [Kofleriaceae bacterium]